MKSSVWRSWSPRSHCMVVRATTRIHGVMGSMHATCPTHHSEPLAMYKGTMQTNAAFGPHLVRFPFHGYVFPIEIIPRNSENPSRLMPKPKKPRPRMSPRPCHMKVALAAPARLPIGFSPQCDGLVAKPPVGIECGRLSRILEERLPPRGPSKPPMIGNQTTAQPNRLIAQPNSAKPTCRFEPQPYGCHGPHAPCKSFPED